MRFKGSGLMSSVANSEKAYKEKPNWERRVSGSVKNTGISDGLDHRPVSSQTDCNRCILLPAFRAPLGFLKWRLGLPSLVGLSIIFVALSLACSSEETPATPIAAQMDPIVVSEPAAGSSPETVESVMEPPAPPRLTGNAQPTQEAPSQLIESPGRTPDPSPEPAEATLAAPATPTQLAPTPEPLQTEQSQLGEQAPPTQMPSSQVPSSSEAEPTLPPYAARTPPFMDVGETPEPASVGGADGSNSPNAEPGRQGPTAGYRVVSVPEKRKLKYPNLGSQLNQLVVSVEEGRMPASEAAESTPLFQDDSVAVTIRLSDSVSDVVQFLDDNGGDPRNVGEDYIEAYVPVTLLGALSLQPGVIRVREIVPPQPAAQSQSGGSARP